MDAVRIGDHAQIADSIIGRKVVVESTHEHPTYIESNSVIGNAVQLEKGCKLVRTRINPGLKIPPGMRYLDTFLQTYEDLVERAT
jgi:NDP-sugar pyrophosphorylase family protein